MINTATEQPKRHITLCNRERAAAAELLIWLHHSDLQPAGRDALLGLMRPTTRLSYRAL